MIRSPHQKLTEKLNSGVEVRFISGDSTGSDDGGETDDEGDDLRGRTGSFDTASKSSTDLPTVSTVPVLPPLILTFFPPLSF